MIGCAAMQPKTDLFRGDEKQLFVVGPFPLGESVFLSVQRCA